MSERTWRNDFFDFLVAAQSALQIAAKDGDGKHVPGTWMSQTIEEQLKHIEAHITAYECGDQYEDHLAHIVCRAAIAVALRRRL